MDNKKISIDDLFRQRLGEREVPPPPGAWSRMEGLLDAKMPVGVAPAVARRPSRGWAFLLLGLVVAGGGSFLYHRAQEKPAAAPVIAQNTFAENAGETTGIPENPTHSNAKEERPVAHIAAAQPAHNKVSAVSAPAVADVKNEKRRTISGKSALISGNAASVESRKTSVHAFDNQSLAFANKAEKLPAPAMSPTQPAVPEISGNPAPARVREEIAPMAAVASRVAEVFSGKLLNPLNVARVENYLLQWAGGENHPAGNAPPNGWSAKIPAGTVGAQANSAKAAAPVLLSSLESLKNTLPETAGKTPSAPEAATITVAQTPEQKIENAVEDLRQARFTVGMLAGINSTLSGAGGALQGLHAGIMGLLTLSEKWSLGAELRYAFRLNSSMDLKDDYFSGKVINEASVTRNGKPYRAVRYDVDSTLSRYSFTSYQVLELPLQVRYNHNRLSVYGGPNLAFHFAPAVTKTNTRIGTISRYDTLDAALPLPTLPSRAAENSVSDFDGRFSIGYNAGAQYRISPALSLDLRLTQQLWDSRQGRGVGSRRVSETYIYIPSVQLSVGYFWGQKPAKKQAAKP